MLDVNWIPSRGKNWWAFCSTMLYHLILYLNDKCYNVIKTKSYGIKLILTHALSSWLVSSFKICSTWAGLIMTSEKPDSLSYTMSKWALTYNTEKNSHYKYWDPHTLKTNDAQYICIKTTIQSGYNLKLQLILNRTWKQFYNFNIFNCIIM